MLTKHPGYFKYVVWLTTTTFLFGFAGCLPENYFGQIATSTSTAIADAVTMIVADRAANALFGQVGGVTAGEPVSDEEEEAEEPPPFVPNPGDEPPPFP